MPVSSIAASYGAGHHKFTPGRTPRKARRCAKRRLINQEALPGRWAWARRPSARSRNGAASDQEGRGGTGSDVVYELIGFPSAAGLDTLACRHAAACLGALSGGLRYARDLSAPVSSLRARSSALVSMGSLGLSREDGISFSSRQAV